MARWTKWLAPWYKEDEATKSENKVDAAVEESRAQINRAQAVAKSYREMSVILTTLRK